MGKLREKYSNHSMVKYKVWGEGLGRGVSGMMCDLCGSVVREKVDREAKEVMCHRCLMGLADGYDPERAFTQAELVGSIRDRVLEKFRTKYGLTQAFLAKQMGMSIRQYQRYEKGKYISIDRAVEAANKIGM
jgi:DNA-binding XRE family transcriptional regulator